MQKISVGIMLILSISLLSFTNKKNNHFIPEPADPVKQDISVWKNIKPGVHAGFGSVDVAYSKSIPPLGKVQENRTLQAWRGERVNCLLLVWSSDNKNEISIKASQFRKDNYQLGKEITSISIVKYVLSDAFAGGCGERNKDKFPVHLSPDLLEKANSFDQS